jgi:hypothetical protein
MIDLDNLVIFLSPRLLMVLQVVHPMSNDLLKLGVILRWHKTQIQEKCQKGSEHFNFLFVVWFILLSLEEGPNHQTDPWFEAVNFCENSSKPRLFYGWLI